MALRKLRVMCAGGDKVLAEWDTETVSPARLAEIETEFHKKVAQGWFAADITVADPKVGTDGKLIRQFNPNADLLLIPRVQGGWC